VLKEGKSFFSVASKFEKINLRLFLFNLAGTYRVGENNMQWIGTIEKFNFMHFPLSIFNQCSIAKKAMREKNELRKLFGYSLFVSMFSLFIAQTIDFTIFLGKKRITFIAMMK
jgi:hypothetical protein